MNNCESALLYIARLSLVSFVEKRGFFRRLISLILAFLPLLKKIDTVQQNTRIIIYYYNTSLVASSLQSWAKLLKKEAKVKLQIFHVK